MKTLNLTQLMKSSVLIISLSLASFSCSKKSSTVQGTTKTQSNIVNSNTTTRAQTQAASLNINYKMNKIGVPVLNTTTNQMSVTSEIITPSGLYIPITTNHTNTSGNQDAYGTYTDSSNYGVQLQIFARCGGNNCEKYTMLVTIIKNGYAYHQLAVVSYSGDLKFNYEERDATASQTLFSTLSEVESYFTSMGVVALNDGGT